jgi:hypothetical protein
MMLNGIVGAKPRLAIISTGSGSKIVGVGDRIGDAVVVSILDDRVVLKQGATMLELRFGGEHSS